MGRPTLPESAGKTAACHKKAPTDILCFEVPVPSEIVIIQKEQHMEIYGTLGPACHSKEILTSMFRAGMTGMRLNLSHTALRESSPLIDTFHAAAEEAGVIPKLLIDMQGPELRIGALSHDVTLRDGEMVTLGEGGIPIPDCVLSAVRPGSSILLDDGKILLVAERTCGNHLQAAVMRGGILSGRKSIAIPGEEISRPAMTEMDLANIADARMFGVTGIMQPFVRSRDDLITVRRALSKAGCSNIRLFAKIENLDGVRKIDELLPWADEIVIARGDLGNAVPLWTLPAVQKDLAEKCRHFGTPFMVVTQMLASMEKNPVPTRAEVSDIFNAVLDGASSVMVTGETAVGQYPVEVIDFLARTVREAQKYSSV